MKRIFLITSLIILAVSCLNKEEMENSLDSLDERVAALEKTVAEINNNTLAISKFIRDSTIIVRYTETDHGYELELSDGTKITITDGADAPEIVPIISIDKDGNWIMSVDGGETFIPIKNAVNAFKETGQTPQLKVDDEGYWLVSTDGGGKIL